jgi:hypothetical protein
MSDSNSLESNNKESFGACTFSSMSPTTLAPNTKAVNFVLSFEEALKLNVAIAAAVQELTRKSRATPEKRRAGVKLIVHLEGKERIRVQIGRVPRKNAN